MSALKEFSKLIFGSFSYLVVHCRLPYFVALVNFYLVGLSISAVAEINNNTPPATAAESKLELLNHLKIKPKIATINSNMPNQRSNFINKFILHVLLLLFLIKKY
jgi:hypothetical protein